MITITLQSKKEYYEATFPENWEELSMYKFQQILKHEECSDLKFLEILSGIEEEKLSRCETKSVLWLIMQLREQFSIEKLDELSKEKLMSFECEGESYEITPDLGNSTIGEYYSILKIEDGIEKKQYQLFPLFLATLYRPKGEEYDNKKCLERVEKFNSLPVTIFYRARNFFLFLQEISKINIQAYGEQNQAA